MNQEETEKEALEENFAALQEIFSQIEELQEKQQNAFKNYLSFVADNLP